MRSRRFALTFGMPVLEEPPLAADRLGRIVGDRIDLERDIGESGHGCRRVPGQTVLAVLTFFAVLRLHEARNLGVVVDQRGESSVGNAVGQYVEVEDANQRIAASDAVVRLGRGFSP